jgi:hypothetical protein
LLLAAVLVLSGLPAWCQVDTSATDAGSADADDVPMLVPPPVSSQSYPTEFAGEAEKNYLLGGLTIGSAYSSNVTRTSNPVGDMSYSIWPTIAIRRVTPQLRLALSYSPGFTVYQKTSGYNQANQDLSLHLEYRMTPNLSVNVQEAFQKLSNIFDQPAPLVASPVSGSMPISGVGVVAPLADQIINSTAVQVTYQLGAGSMVGVSGSYGNLHYLNAEQAAGLYNLQSAGGSVFYSYQLGDKYYIGANYLYQNIRSYQSSSPSTLTQTQGVFAFLSVYLKPKFSVSISVGPQYYVGSQPPSAPVSSWSPLVIVSGAWQGRRTTVAASYSHTVSAAFGLGGIFNSNTLDASANWKISRNWTTGIEATYGNNASLTPMLVGSDGARTVIGTVSAQRALGEHANFQVGYNWTNQNYEQTARTASIPNINRVFLSLNYQFSRPLGRN